MLKSLILVEDDDEAINHRQKMLATKGKNEILR